MKIQTIETKLLPQYKHRLLASRSSSTTQLCAIGGSQFGAACPLWRERGRKLLRLQPIQDRTMGVAIMKDVTVQQSGGAKAKYRQRKTLKHNRNNLPHR